MRLSELQPNQKALVLKVHEGPSSLRIMELGLVVGANITFKSLAPMGDPIAFQLDSSAISLRKTEAVLVEIELIS
jgi:ferrous iron transport protein B